jgi:hypothetical protein
MEHPEGEALPDRDFVHPISVCGTELQESVIASGFPGGSVPAVLWAYRLVLAWSKGVEALGEVSDVPDLVAWEEEILLGTREDEWLWAPVAVIAGELQEPAAADPERLARACMVLSEWAFASGQSASGLLFAEVAALASPGNPRRAYLAGRILRERGRFREAERWFRRAGYVAAAGGDGKLEALVAVALEDLTDPLDA